MVTATKPATSSEQSCSSNFFNIKGVCVHRKVKICVYGKVASLIIPVVEMIINQCIQKF